jgi:hypothetical protein
MPICRASKSPNSPRRAARIGAVVLLFLALATSGCSAPDEPAANEALTIQLRWIKGYPSERKRNVETGLNWALSFLGASLPESARVYVWRGQVVSVNMEAAGVLPESRAAWIEVLAALKNSDEYRKMGAMDIGRFLMLTLCSSHQYFALTGVPRTFDEFRARHPQEWHPAAVVESSIAKGNRLLQVGNAARFADIFFVAYEGTGSLVEGSFQKAETETLDFMPNGQLRFGLYDHDGNLKTAATPALTAAGKPSNCLWCHEIRLQPPFRNVTSVPGYYSASELRAIIAERMRLVEEYRRTLRSSVDFARTDDHTFAELLYLSFAEPSVARLASEWKLPEEEVRTRLAGLQTHAQAERKILGDHLYDRADVDRFAPYPTLAVPSNVRNAGGYEPRLLAPEASLAP